MTSESTPWLTAHRHAGCAATHDAAPATRLTVACAPAEMASLSATLRAHRPIGAVTIRVSALRGAGGRAIPSSAVDVFVVRDWVQAGVGVYQSEPARVAELLLKDDDADLRDGYRRRCGHWRHVHRRGAFYAAPDLRLQGPARATLGADTARQIWIAVRAPAGAAPGVYRGDLEVEPVEAGIPRARLPIEVEVLPFELVESERELFLWYRGTLDCRRPRYYVSEALLRLQLEDIHAHGFRTISLSEGDPALLQRAVDVAYDVGFRGRVVLVEPYPPRGAAIDFHGLQPLLYVSDEMDLRGPATVAAHLTNWDEAARRRLPTMCALVQESFARRLFDAADIGHPPDVLLYYLPRNLQFFAMLAGVPELRRRPTYFYWHAHMEKPLLHRVLTGAYLWKSGADGIAPYCYQHLPEPPYSPYDDFDEWDSHERAVSGGHAFKDHLATYPARRGSVPTVQWKGLSAGLYDLRYLETVHALRHQAEERGGAAASTAREVWQAVEASLQRLSLRDIDITSETNVRPYADVDADDLDALRHVLARGAVEVSSRL